MKYIVLILILPITLLICIIFANIVYATATPIKNDVYYLDNSEYSTIKTIIFYSDNTAQIGNKEVTKYTVNNNIITILGSNMKKSGFSIEVIDNWHKEVIITYTCRAAIIYQVIFIIVEITLAFFIFIALIINRDTIQKILLKHER